MTIAEFLKKYDNFDAPTFLLLLAEGFTPEKMEELINIDSIPNGARNDAPKMEQKVLWEGTFEECDESEILELLGTENPEDLYGLEDDSPVMSVINGRYFSAISDGCMGDGNYIQICEIVEVE